MSLIAQVSGTPYIPGGDSPAGTDCSGLASWVANVASGRPAYGSRFNTGNIESSLLARGFHYGTAPNSVVIGWNGGHAAVTLPDGTPVSSGESGSGVRIGGGGAYQPQFSRHMYLPVQAEEMHTTANPADPAALADPMAPVDPMAPADPLAPVDPMAPVDPAMLQEDPAVIVDVANAPVPDPAAADPALGDPALGDPVLGDPALADAPANQAPRPEGVIQPAAVPEVEDPALVIPGAELPA